MTLLTIAILLFTFLELLIVIAIVAVLAALLIPTLLKAKEKSEQATKCLRLVNEINDALDDCKSYARRRISGEAGTDDATLQNKLKSLKDKVAEFLNDCINNNTAMATLAKDKIDAAIRELNRYLPAASEENKTKVREVIHDLNGLKRRIPQD